MLTGEEAKTKWCPFLRVNLAAITNIYGSMVPSGPAGNATEIGTGIDRVGNCIADGCMMWRSESDFQYSLRVQQTQYKKSERTGKQCTDAIPMGGCCGLAWRPE